MRDISSDEFLYAAARLGYAVFRYVPARRANLNIIGWRFSSSRPDYFDDLLSVYWQIRNHVWIGVSFPITTLPGIPYLLNPIAAKGTAILVPGQYRSSYTLSSYKGYLALKQTAPVKVFRDKNQDSAFDKNPDTIEQGLFGIHIHRAGIFSKLVGVSSAGCQVFQKRKDYETFIKLCKFSAEDYGPKFTYTLLDIV